MKKSIEVTFCDLCGKEVEMKDRFFVGSLFYKEYIINSKGSKVKTTHNFEDLCPDCQKRVFKDLNKIIEKIKREREEKEIQASYVECAEDSEKVA